MDPSWSSPSHPGILEVVSQSGSYTSYAVAKRTFPPGAVLATLKAPMLTLSKRAYSSVQVGPKQQDNIELNCDFLYINHSCEPNLEFRVQHSDCTRPNAAEHDHHIQIEVRAAPRTNLEGQLIGIESGEALSFFYPSSEWDMAQAFECNCRTSLCKGRIQGARYLRRDELQDYFVNDHIWQLKDEQDREEHQGLSSTGDDSGNISSGGTGRKPHVL